MLNGNTAEALAQLGAILVISIVLIVVVIGIAIIRWLSKRTDKDQEKEDE